MLKQLKLQNIILVEKADIPFKSGLNILTGETGSGKSAIMSGLNLALGERSDTNIIRRGSEKGIVEAIFDIEGLNVLIAFLEDSGIEHEPNQELIIKREISISGKSRVFINNQQTQLQLLKKVGILLAQFVNQRANQQLFSQDYHREVLDLYADLTPLVKDYKTSYLNEKSMREQLNTFIRQEAQRLREIAICQTEITELEEAQLKEHEDEEIFAEYTVLVNSKELMEMAHEINQSLSGERQSVLNILNRNKLCLDSIAAMDSKLLEPASAFHNALLEIQEVSYTLRKYAGSLNHQPDRLNEINERLALINRLKRKYGSTIQEIQVYIEEAKNKLNDLENRETQIEELQLQLTKVEDNTNQLALQLTEQRELASRRFEQDLTEQLQSLNMAKAQFIVQVDLQKRTHFGDNKVEFFLQPNTGEHQISLREEASGGEISRVLLSLQTILAGKDRIPSIIFDEVDSNIGGETAAIVGEKLRKIGQKHQVICVTHFPQVASRAHHHLQISKSEKNGRTLTEIKSLTIHSQQKELERMVGGSLVIT